MTTMRARMLRVLGVTAIATAVVLPATAMAQTSGETGYGGGNSVPTSVVEVSPSTVAVKKVAAQGGSLPITGGDVAALAAMGAVATLGGLALVRSSRRRDVEPGA